MLSKRYAVESAEGSFGAGFLAKPLTPAQLEDAIASVLEGRIGPPVKILLVEDDETLRRLFVAALEGFDVCVAPDTDAALEILAAEPDVALVLAADTARVDAAELVIGLLALFARHGRAARVR